MDSRSTLETTCRRSWRTVEGDRCRICGAFLAMALLAWGNNSARSRQGLLGHALEAQDGGEIHTTNRQDSMA